MKSKSLTVILVMCVFCQEAELKTYNPATSSELHSAFKNAVAGDTISLDATDYEGDFTLSSSGEDRKVITLIGKSEEEKHTTIIGSSNALYIKGNYWSIQGLEIKNGDTAVIIEGRRNLIESLVIGHAKKGIVIKGGDNTVKGCTVTSRGAAISIEKGDGNKILSSSVLMLNPSLFIYENTCCGAIETSTFSGPVQVNGNKYQIYSNVASAGVNFEGCFNELSSNVFSNVYLTKKCTNTDAGLNMYKGVVDSMQPFDMEKVGNFAGRTATGSQLAVMVAIFANVLFLSYSAVLFYF